MKKLMYIAATCGTVILTGCASLDDRLASNDPRVRSAAERELLQTSRATGTEADRVAAVKRITDKDYLYEIAMNATTNAWVAEDKSFDPALYDGCSSAGNVRIYYKMTSGAPLYVTVRGKRLDTTKEGVAAVEQLRLDETQKENLVKIFKLIHKAESDQVKLSAFKCVKDSKRIQTAASLLARHATDPKVQAVGLAKLDPEERLAAIARNGSDAKERLEAFNKLKDQKAVDEIALKTNDKAILLAGMSKVSNKAALASRVFGKDFVADGNAIDLSLVLEYLKRVGDGRKEIWNKLAEKGQLQEIETRMARLYRDKYASMSDEGKGMLISAITTPEVIAKMIVPPILNETEKRQMEYLERETMKTIKKLDFELGTAMKIFPKIKDGKKEDDDEWKWLQYETPDLSDEERSIAISWSCNNYNVSEFLSFVNEMKSERQKQQKIIEPILSAKAKSIYVEDKGARATLLAKVSPDILDKVFPFKGILGIKFGEVVDIKGGRFEHGAQGVAPASTRVPFTPQRGLPQFSSYWYRASIKSHRVFMIEAKTEAPLDRNEFDNLVKSLEKKYGQAADKWKGEGMDVGDAVGDIKTFFVTRYTFHFPGNRRLVLEDRARRFGGGIMDEVIMSQSVDKKKRGYVSLVAYDDNAMKAADAEVGAAARERKQREEKKSADAAKRISDAL